MQLTQELEVYGVFIHIQIPMHIQVTRAIPVSCKIEMFNTHVAVRLWAPYWQDKSIWLCYDNKNAVVVCNTSKTKDLLLNLLLQTSAFLFVFNLTLIYKQNILTDWRIYWLMQKVSPVIWKNVSHRLSL